jgi:hypothetical protein
MENLRDSYPQVLCLLNDALGTQQYPYFLSPAINEVIACVVGDAGV